MTLATASPYDPRAEQTLSEAERAAIFQQRYRTFREENPGKAHFTMEKLEKIQDQLRQEASRALDGSLS